MIEGDLRRTGRRAPDAADGGIRAAGRRARPRLALALIALAAVVGHQLNRAGPADRAAEPTAARPLGPARRLGHASGHRLRAGSGCGCSARPSQLPWRRLLLTGWLLNLAWMCFADAHRRAGGRAGSTCCSTRTSTCTTCPGSTTRGPSCRPSPTTSPSGTASTAPPCGPPTSPVIPRWPRWCSGCWTGSGWAAGPGPVALCILVGSAVSVALPVTLRELGAAAAARRLVPLVALFPGAVWMAVSADGLFAGVAVSGLALVCVGAVRQPAPGQPGRRPAARRRRVLVLRSGPVRPRRSRSRSC